MSIRSRFKNSLNAAALTLLAIVGMSPKNVRKSFTSRINRSRYTPHQGARECARRRRQMDSGMLRAANGVQL
jgi:hypothetical protein